MSEGRGPGTAEILIIDDTAANLRLLSRMLSDQGYAVRAVTSGQRALASVAAVPPDLILLDIRMPGMDGYQVCERLKADERTAGIPILFISALDAVEDKVKAFAAGGVDYVTKPFQFEEVLARVQAHLSLQRLQRQLQEANAKMERELALAGRIQAGFLPGELPQLPGWQLSVTLIPARETSGDFYDVHPLPDGRLGILVADVVDKGVGAALYMALSWSLIRTFAAEYPGQPERVLAAVNGRILSDTQSDQFVTVFYGVVDPAAGTVTYCNAGHDPPYLVSARDGGAARPLPKTGMALGVAQDETWGQQTICVAPGDVLVLYTDGVTDAQNPERSFFGTERLLAAVRTSAGGSAHDIQAAITADLCAFVGDTPQFDDIALAVLVRDPA